MRESDSRANATLGLLVLLGAVVAIGAVVGATQFQTTSSDASIEGPETTAAPTAATTDSPAVQAHDAPENRSVEIVFEQWQDKVYVAANGGEDLPNVTAFSIEGATLNGSLDPSDDYPEVRGTVDAPTTVVVRATFEDGTTQVVGRLEVSAVTTTAAN